MNDTNGRVIVCSNVLPVSSEPVKNGAVAVEDGKIKLCGKADEIKSHFPGFTVCDLGAGILLPGFINCHTHLELGWLKPAKEFSGFVSWLSYIIGKKSAGVKTREIEKSVKDGIETLIKSGVTTVGEISSYGNDSEILKNSPLRTVLFREVTDSKPAPEPLPEKTDRFEERFFPHAPYSCSPELIKKMFKISVEKGLPAGIHLAESPEETAFVRGEKNGIEESIYPVMGKSPMRRHTAQTPFMYFSKMDNPAAKITAIHMAHIEKNEIEKIRKRGLGIVLCPRSNRFLNTGDAPAREYMKLERVGLGTDGLSSNKTLNFFDEIRALYELLLPLGAEKAAKKAVYTATLGGAKALFIEDRAGSIETGKDADLIFIESGAENPYFGALEASRASVV